MIFVNPTHFEYEPYKIANINENGDAKLNLARFIAVYEKQCLIQILGHCLYKELFESFKIASGANVYTLNTDATIPIKNLVNGLEYDVIVNDSFGCICGCNQNNCKKRYWKGIVDKSITPIGNIEKSFLIPYIYYHYLLVNRSQTTGTGQQVLAGENSQTVQNFSKRIDAYNDFLFMVFKDLYQFLRANKADYPTWVNNCNLNFKDKY